MFYILNKDTREVIRSSDTPFNIDETVQPPAPYIQLKRAEDDTKPAFNAATQKLNQTFVDDDAAFTRTFKYEVVALTQAEIDMNTQVTQDEAQRLQIKAFITALVNGTGTAGERIARVEKACAYLLRNEVRR